MSSPQQTDAPGTPADNVQPDEVRRLAALARLRLSEEEAEKLAGELDRLLGYARQLGELDTTGVEPMEQPAVPHASKTLRPDEARQRISREEALENAPDAKEGHFRVPKAVE